MRLLSMFRRLIDSPSTYFVGAVILLLVAVATQFELNLPSRPRGTVDDISQLKTRDDLNVVFIVVDTLRADRMSLYGYHRPTTPVIDGLAENGIVFDQVISQSSWTKSSMASLWTATYPARNGVLRFDNVLPEEAVMPAEIFQSAGYRTIGIWRNGWVAANFGFDQGFDIYHKPRPGVSARLQRHSPAPQPIGGTDEDISTETRDFLDRFGQDKFFLYLHLMDLHQYVFDEYADPFGPSYSDAYDKALDWTDRVIGAVVDSLDDAGVLQRTLISISSDHGEAFMEHGSEGHARDLYREVVHVPFIIVLPLILDRGIRVGTTIANVDVWPTLLDLVGLPSMNGADGKSMMPLVLAAAGVASGGSVDALNRPVISHMDQHWGGRTAPQELVSLIDDGLRVIVHPEHRTRDEFYDWNVDPNEKSDRFAENPPKLKSMVDRIERYLRDAEPPWGVESPTIELDAMRLNQLRALGYRPGS
jgi:arylsulfatase A-like enzyme